MTFANDERIDLPDTDTDGCLTAMKPTYSRQGSLKRHQQNDDHSDNNTVSLSVHSV